MRIEKEAELVTASGRRFLTLTEAAAVLEVSRPTLDRIILRGELRTVKIGLRRKVRPRDLERYVERRTVGVHGHDVVASKS